MAKRSEFPKVVSRRKKRLGQGYGSGKGGHTSSHGQKGQKSRGKVGVLFEGVKVRKSLLKRLPLQRGKDKFKGAKKPVAISVGDLEVLKNDSKVDATSLVEAKLVSKKNALSRGVKILSNGKLTKKLTVTIPTSKSAARAIEKAGGKIE